MATVDPYFIGDMAFATPLRTMKVVDALRNLREAKMTAQTWGEAQREFFKYIMDQDGLFFHFPKDGIYDNQRQLREELKARWIENTGDQIGDPETETVPASEAENFSQRPAIVSWYSAERGYGFVEAGLPKSIFIHRSVLEQSGIDKLEKDGRIVCDIAPVPKGKLVAIAIHSVQRAGSLDGSEPDNALRIDGVIGFWNSQKGYGFIKVPELDEDVFISCRSDEGKFADQLQWGAKVKGRAARQRFGKFAVTTIESIT
jgi:cold shock protein